MAEEFGVAVAVAVAVGGPIASSRLTSGNPRLRSPIVSDDRPFAELPDEVALTRDEVAMILFALDVVEEADVEPAEAAKVRRAIRLLTPSSGPSSATSSATVTRSSPEP